MDFTYLFPDTAPIVEFGGATTHISGFLDGALQCGVNCSIFTTHTLPGVTQQQTILPLSGDPYILRETRNLGMSSQSHAEAENRINVERPKFIYQRHVRYSYAGAKLAQSLGLPLVLEFNGFEMVMAKHWDPARFPLLLQLAERRSLEAATLIVVVSEFLKQDLMKNGFPEHRILVNANGVDTVKFSPGRKGKEIRNKYGFKDDDIVVAFTGSITVSQGICEIEEVILELSGREKELNIPHLRFLIVGSGLHAQDMRQTLAEQINSGVVICPGNVPHEDIVGYLDAADILLAPHRFMPESMPYFGSPTKQFEYMAMMKGIVASDLKLDPPIHVHEKTALLITPGSTDELKQAIVRMSGDTGLRHRLGESARKVVEAQYTWKHNAQRVLERMTANQERTTEPDADPKS